MDPQLPSRIVEPDTSSEVSAPTPAHCVACAEAGNAALAARSVLGQVEGAEAQPAEGEQPDAGDAPAEPIKRKPKK